MGTKTMLSPQEIMDGLQAKNRLLTQKNEEYLKLVEKRAEAERRYNVAVATETFTLKSNDHPITIIDKLVKGNKTVSNLKYDYDVAQGVERACLESIKDIRTAIDSYRSLLTWLRAEMTGGGE
jgi:hypothetical protein